MHYARVLVVASALAIVTGCTSHDSAAPPRKPSPSAPIPFVRSTSRANLGTSPGNPAAKVKLPVTTCRIENTSLRLGTLSRHGAAASVDLYVKLLRGQSCILSGYGYVALYAEDGSEVPTAVDEDASPAPTAFTLRSGQQAVQRLHWRTAPVSDEPGGCGPAALVLSVRLDNSGEQISLLTESAAGPQGFGAICDHGHLMHSAWVRA